MDKFRHGINGLSPVFHHFGGSSRYGVPVGHAVVSAMNPADIKSQVCYEKQVPCRIIGYVMLLIRKPGKFHEICSREMERFDLSRDCLNYNAAGPCKVHGWVFNAGRILVGNHISPPAFNKGVRCGGIRMIYPFADAYFDMFKFRELTKYLHAGVLCLRNEAKQTSGFEEGFDHDGVI